MQRPPCLRLLSVLLAAGLLAIVTACSDGDSSDEDSTDESPIPIEDRDTFGPEQPNAQDRVGAEQPSCAADAAISWNQAVDYVGRQVSVIGPVRSVDSSGSDVVITMGAADTEPGRRLDIILTENAVSGIQGDPVELFRDEEICAIGVIQAVQGNLQIVVNEAGDILPL